jgi:hypothetical protein
MYNITEQYTYIIDRQKQTLLEAKRRQGQRPRDRKSRKKVYSNFIVALMLKRNKVQKYIVYLLFILPVYLPCTIPITQLRYVTIKDLQLEIYYRGTYLLLQSIILPSCITAIIAIIEDKNSNAIILQLYQQEDKDCTAADIVDVGILLLVRSPTSRL